MKKLILGIFLASLWFQTAFAQATNFGFTPTGSTQNISASSSSSNILLNSSPGDTILVQNTGASTAYVKCATAAATTDIPIQSGWSIALNCPPNNRVAAITASSTTTLTVTKGLGNFAITGGGSSGGGGGGAVTIADGADVTQGAIADAASTVGGVGTLSAKLRLMTTQLGTINTTLGSPFQTGGSIANTSFGISGTLPAFTTTPTFNIGTAPSIVIIGPTTDGTAASTNPVLISGTTDGTATGLVAVPKVTAGGVLSVDGSASTQPVSAASLPLPTGAATSAAQTTMAANQTGGGQKTQIVDGSSNVISATANALDVNVKSGGVGGLTQAPIAPAAATATKSDLIGCQYNTPAVVFTNSQQGPIACGASGEFLISGTVASGATDSGNPVKIGGKYNASIPSLSDGQRSDLQMDSKGGVLAVLKVAGSTNLISTPQTQTDGVSASTATLTAQAFNLIYNGTTFDRLRGDVTGLWIGNEARTTNKTAAPNAGTVRPIATTVGAAVNKPFQVPELDWTYPAAAGGISNTTTAVTMVAAAGAGIRNYITSVQLSAGALGAATEVAIRDGAGGTVIWRGFLSTSGGAVNAQLSSPIKSTANTLLEVVTLTATITGAVYVNAQGYQAP